MCNVTRSLERNLEPRLTLNKKHLMPGVKILKSGYRGGILQASDMAIRRSACRIAHTDTLALQVQKIKLPKDFKGNATPRSLHPIRLYPMKFRVHNMV